MFAAWRGSRIVALIQLFLFPCDVRYRSSFSTYTSMFSGVFGNELRAASRNPMGIDCLTRGVERFVVSISKIWRYVGTSALGTLLDENLISRSS